MNKIYDIVNVSQCILYKTKIFFVLQNKNKIK